jgi:hypothetical protein
MLHLTYSIAGHLGSPAPGLNTLPEDKILVRCDIRVKQAPAAIRYLLKKDFNSST